MTKAQTQTDESGIDRRTFLRASAATVGAATVGAGSMHSDRLSPVGEAEAIAPAVVVAGAAGVTVGAGAAVAVYEWHAESGDVDEGAEDDLLQDQLYETGLSVAEGRENWVKETEELYSSSSDNPFTRAAWSALNTEVTRMVLEGKSQTEILSEAQDVLNSQYLISVHNILERWNAGVNALIEQFIVDYNAGTEAFRLHLNNVVHELVSVEPEHVSSDWEPVEASAVDGGYLVYRVEADDLPTNHTFDEVNRSMYPEIEDIDQDRPEYLAIMYSDEEDPTVSGPFEDQFSSPTGITVANSEWEDGDDADEHGAVVLDEKVFEPALSRITSGFEEIEDDLDVFVDSMYNAIHEGSIQPSQLLGPTDIFRQFADSEEQALVATQLAASGVNVPSHSGYQAEISHDDIVSETLWVWFWPYVDEDVEISAGTTLTPDDYGMAYIAYHSAVDGEFQTRVLSGSDSDLEIHSLDGVDGQEDLVDDTEGIAAGDDGEVIVWDEETHGDAPDALLYPNDHEEWSIIVYGASNQSTHEISEVVEDDGVYSLPETDLNDGEQVENVTLVPSVDFVQPVSIIDDPADIDEEDIQQRVDAMEDLYDALEEWADDDSLIGGGGLFGGGMPDWFPKAPGLTRAQTAVAGAGGLLALNFLR